MRGGRTLAVLLGAQVVLGACGGSSKPPAATSVTTSTASAVSPSTAATTTALPATPVPAATAALIVDGRNIVAINAEGKRLKTLVTVYADQHMLEVQLARDHNSVWYLERGLNQGFECGTLVHLDLVTNKREEIARAEPRRGRQTHTTGRRSGASRHRSERCGRPTAPVSLR